MPFSNAVDECKLCTGGLKVGTRGIRGLNGPKDVSGPKELDRLSSTGRTTV